MGERRAVRIDFETQAVGKMRNEVSMTATWVTAGRWRPMKANFMVVMTQHLRRWHISPPDLPGAS